MSARLALHSTLSLWRSSNFVSLSSNHSFMTCHCASSRAVYASSIVAILSLFWCSWVTSRAGCLTVCSIWLLQSPGVLTGPEVSFFSDFGFLLRSHCSLAATKDMLVVFPALWPVAPLAYPASTTFISLSIGGSSLIPPLGLLPSWITIMSDLLAVALHHLCSASFDCPGGLDVSFWGQFNAWNRMLVSVWSSP